MAEVDIGGAMLWGASARSRAARWPTIPMQPAGHLHAAQGMAIRVRARGRSAGATLGDDPAEFRTMTICANGVVEYRRAARLTGGRL